MRFQLKLLTGIGILVCGVAACSSDKTAKGGGTGGADAGPSSGGSTSSSGGASGSGGTSAGTGGGLSTGGGGATSSGVDGGDAGPAHLDHVFYIMMENHATDEIIGNTADAPYINQLAGQYGVATNYYGVTHPSLPNYLAAISGDFQGVFDDCAAGEALTCAPEEFVPGAGDPTTAAPLTAAQITSATAQVHWFTGQNIVDQLETAHLTWKAYMQSIPAVGSTVEYAPVDTVDGGAVPRKLYAQKHDPFMYFSDIRSSADRMKLIVPFTGFAADLAGNVPNFVWISPDQCNDMHGVAPENAVAVGIPDCGYPASGLDHKVIGLGDAFLKDTVTKIMASPAWQQNSAIVIAWDEDDYAGSSGCCDSPTGANGVVLGGARAPALVITSKNAKKQSIATNFNHYSLLGTIEDELGLSCLGNACKPDQSLMTKLFRP